MRILPASFLFLNTSYGSHTRFCQSAQEKLAVNKIIEKYRPMNWPESFLIFRKDLKDVDELTDLQKQNPLLGDQDLQGGYLELALRNLEFFRSSSDLNGNDSDWHRRLLIRTMLYRLPLHRLAEHGQTIGNRNPFESYMHLTAIELEVDLMLRQQYSCPLQNIKVLLQEYFSSHSGIERRILTSLYTGKHDLSKQPYEIQCLNEIMQNDSNSRVSSLNLWYAGALWNHLTAMSNNSQCASLKSPFKLLPHKNISLDKALHDRLDRLQNTTREISSDVVLLFLGYCYFVARMLPFENAHYRPVIEYKLLRIVIA